ncbi:uncharacterized protein LOC134837108 [Culicoides brevitarsis]|uniref:uncharacterized protein LOC134837108 n=1 Tax=Culicoides brevitarsis TaxID=469753 RepID=UPI00307C9AD5
MSFNQKVEPASSAPEVTNKTTCQISLERFLIENNLYPPPLNLSSNTAGITPGGMIWSNQGIPNPILIPRQNTAISVDHEIPAVLIEKKAGRSVTFAPNPIYHPAPSPPVANGNAVPCENCPALIHLMFNYFVEIVGGLHEPISPSTSSEDLIKHLSNAFCYTVNDIQNAIRCTEHPYRCRSCSPEAGFGSRTELFEHMRVVHEPQKVPCPQCNRMFKTPKLVQAHVRRMHEPRPVKQFRCSVLGCNKEYLNIKTFKRHIELFHPDVTLHINPVPNVGYVSPSNPQDDNDEPPALILHGNVHGKGQGKAKGGVFNKQAAQREKRNKTKQMMKTRSSKSVSE